MRSSAHYTASIDRYYARRVTQGTNGNWKGSMKWKLEKGSKLKVQLGRLLGTQDSGPVLQYSMLIGFHVLGRWHYAVVILGWRREDGGEIPVGLNQRRGALRTGAVDLLPPHKWRTRLCFPVVCAVLC